MEKKSETKTDQITTMKKKVVAVAAGEGKGNTKKQ